MPNQGTFGFTRGGQLQMFRVVELPTVTIVEGDRKRKVKPRDLYDVLRVIDDHGARCFISVETMAAEARMARSQVARTIKALHGLNLLCIEKSSLPNGGQRNEYQINWQAVSDRCTSRAPTWGQRESPRGDSARPPVGTLIDQEPTNEPPPPTPYAKSALPAAWQAVAAEFCNDISAIADLCREAAATGKTPAAFRQAVALALETARRPANAQKLTSVGGAVAWFLRNSAWPVDGILPLDEILAKERAEAERQERAAKYAREQAEHDRMVEAYLAERRAKYREQQAAGVKA